MQIKATDPIEYISLIPEERQEAFSKLRQSILDNIPEGFEEQMSYGMIGYVIPHTIYAPGYHCNPKLPLPFINIASQKNFIALYHMGLYADEELMKWFLAEYPKHTKGKLDMGKSCVRFKKMDDIPFKLIATLVKKMSAQQYIDIYEKNYKPKK